MAQISRSHANFVNFSMFIVFCLLIKQNSTSNKQKTAFLSIPAGLSTSPQLQKIVRIAYQRSLAATRLKAS